MWNPFRLFPRSWKTDVVVHRGGGRDDRGNPKVPQNIAVTECLLAPRGTVDPVDQSDVVSTTGVLYHETFKFLPTDRIVVPSTARMAGDWAVDGLINEWPFGVEVPLVRT